MKSGFVCSLRYLFFLFLLFFLIQSNAQKLLDPDSVAGLCSSVGWWVWGRIRPLSGLLQRPVVGWEEQRASHSWCPMPAEQPQFICRSSTPSGRCRAVLRTTSVFLFFLPALPALQLSHPGCQLKSSLNRSRRVCRVSAPSVIYTLLPGPLCSIAEK